MSCDHELANERSRCSGKNTSYKTIIIIIMALSRPNCSSPTPSLGHLTTFRKAFATLGQHGGGALSKVMLSFGLYEPVYKERGLPSQMGYPRKWVTLALAHFSLLFLFVFTRQLGLPE